MKKVYLGGLKFGYDPKHDPPSVERTLGDVTAWRNEATERLEAAGFDVLNPLKDSQQHLSVNTADLKLVELADYLLIKWGKPDQHPATGTKKEITRAKELQKVVFMWIADFGMYWCWPRETADGVFETLDEAIAAIITTEGD